MALYVAFADPSIFFFFFFKQKTAYEMARAELKASREKAQLTGNDVSLEVHQVYYKILIAQAHRSSVEAQIKGSQELQSERIQQVKFGSALKQHFIQTQPQLFKAKQKLLPT